MTIPVNSSKQFDILNLISYISQIVGISEVYN